MDLMEPLPAYFGDWQLARWMGVTRTQMLDMPIRDVEEARVTMIALNRAQQQANEQAGKGHKR